jgi:hypothetical protein
MQTPIVPVSYGPLGLANTLTIRGVGPVNDSGCPNYFYDIQRVTEASPAVPEVPATEDTPAIPAVAATYTTVSISNGNAAMTAEQWAAWPSGSTPDDEDYQLTCLADNLSLTRA